MKRTSISQTTRALYISSTPESRTPISSIRYNKDRYDDRDVIITNLLDSYDRLLAFGQRHLNNLFTLDGIVSVNARDHILREITSNLHVHRDFSNAYVAKLIIESDKIYTENSNRAHGFGNLNLATFEPFPKNPAISKVFREIGLADELSSGMRNTYKYTRLYSGTEPEFIEGDIFQTMIPLKKAATATVGPPSSHTTTEVTTQVGTEVTTQVKLTSEKITTLLTFCQIPRTRKEMQEFCEIKTAEYFRKYIIKPMLSEGLIKQTIPDKPNSKNQKYVKA